VPSIDDFVAGLKPHLPDPSTFVPTIPSFSEDETIQRLLNALETTNKQGANLLDGHNRNTEFLESIPGSFRSLMAIVTELSEKNENLTRILLSKEGPSMTEFSNVKDENSKLNGERDYLSQTVKRLERQIQESDLNTERLSSQLREVTERESIWHQNDIEHTRQVGELQSKSKSLESENASLKKQLEQSNKMYDRLQKEKEDDASRNKEELKSLRNELKELQVDLRKSENDRTDEVIKLREAKASLEGAMGVMEKRMTVQVSTSVFDCIVFADCYETGRKDYKSSSSVI
jgi:chromosome segregation ATPase